MLAKQICKFDVKNKNLHRIIVVEVPSRTSSKKRWTFYWDPPTNTQKMFFSVVGFCIVGIVLLHGLVSFCKIEVSFDKLYQFICV